MIFHLAVATGIALVGLVIVWFLRSERAALRHAVLVGSVVAFVVPSQWFGSAGPKLVDCFPARGLGELVEFAWAVGALLTLAYWVRRATRTVPSVREPSQNEIDALTASATGVRLRIVASDIAPGAQGWLRPAILLPDGLSVDLTAPELDAVIAHELAHIRRRDNWTAAVVAIVRSVFWFHPLLWWMERRILAEREIACDEMVVLGGASGEDYVKAIAKVCRRIWVQPVAYASITDSNLKQRMEHIMSEPLKQTSSRLIKISLGTLAAAIVLLPGVNGFLKAQPAATRNPQAEELHGVCAGDIKSGNLFQGEQCLRRLEEMEPGSTRVVLELGNVLVREGKNDEAIDVLKGALHGRGADAKDEAEIYWNLGRIYQAKGDLDSATAMLQESIALDPGRVEARLMLGLIFEARSRREAARQQYVAVLELDPNQPVALNNLAYILADGGGDLKAAADYAERALATAPQNLDMKDTVGWIAYKQQHNDEAIRLFKDIVIAAPSNLDFRGHLVAALNQKGLDSPQMRELKSKSTSTERVLEITKGL